jgi:hypothetical protein
VLHVDGAIAITEMAVEWHGEGQDDFSGEPVLAGRGSLMSPPSHPRQTKRR